MLYTVDLKTYSRDTLSHFGALIILMVRQKFSRFVNRILECYLGGKGQHFLHKKKNKMNSPSRYGVDLTKTESFTVSLFLQCGQCGQCNN